MNDANEKENRCLDCGGHRAGDTTLCFNCDGPPAELTDEEKEHLNTGAKPMNDANGTEQYLGPPECLSERVRILNEAQEYAEGLREASDWEQLRQFEADLALLLAELLLAGS